MDLGRFCDYCLGKPGVTEHFPFDSRTLVFKVGNKMFALADAVDFSSINLKCEPEIAIELRERFPEIIPGYHMNKIHWNTVSVTGDLSENFIFELIDKSYLLIFNSLTKKMQQEIENR